MVDDRLNSCGLFREGHCPRQDEMARVYLIPQILEPGVLAEYEEICCTCRNYVHRSAEGLFARPAYMDGPRADFFFDGVTFSGFLHPETAYF